MNVVSSLYHMVRLLQSYKPRYKHGGAIPCQYDQYGGDYSTMLVWKQHERN